MLAAITMRGSELGRDATDALNAALFTALELSQTDADALFALLGKLRRRAGDFA